MKKIDIIRHLAQSLRKQWVSLEELEILLAIQQGHSSIDDICTGANHEKHLVQALLKRLLKHDEIIVSEKQKGHSPTRYALTESGARIILKAIPSNTK